MAMLRAVVVRVVVGLVFLIALTVAMTDIPGTTASAAPVSFIMEDQLGATVKDLFLVVVNVAIFANGLIIMMSGSRLVFAMSRDKRFPGHQLFGRVIPSTATPAWAVGLIMVGGIVFTLVFSTDALFKLFTAGSILPALIYLATVLMYLKVRPKLKLIPSTMTLGRWEPFVVDRRAAVARVRAHRAAVPEPVLGLGQARRGADRDRRGHVRRRSGSSRRTRSTTCPSPSWARSSPERVHA